MALHIPSVFREIIREGCGSEINFWPRGNLVTIAQVNISFTCVDNNRYRWQPFSPRARRPLTAFVIRNQLDIKFRLPLREEY